MNICLLLLQSEYLHKLILLRASRLKWCWCVFGLIGQCWPSNNSSSHLFFVVKKSGSFYGVCTRRKMHSVLLGMWHIVLLPVVMHWGLVLRHTKDNAKEMLYMYSVLGILAFC